MRLPPAAPALSQFRVGSASLCALSVPCGAASLSSAASSLDRGRAEMQQRRPLFVFPASLPFHSVPFLGKGSFAASHGTYASVAVGRCTEEARDTYNERRKAPEQTACSLSLSLSLSLVCISRASAHQTVRWILSPARALVDSCM